MAKKKSEKKVESAPEKKAPKSLDLLKLCVNKEKLERALRASEGAAKPQTAEQALFQELKGEFAGDELTLEVYRGLGGLVNEERAVRNRKNEAKMEKAKRSR